MSSFIGVKWIVCLLQVFSALWCMSIRKSDGERVKLQFYSLLVPAENVTASEKPIHHKPGLKMARRSSL